MSDVDRLFAEYKAASASGDEVDPGAFLARVEGADRAELTALIDAHLARAPRAAWDSAAFAESAAAPLVESLTKSLRGQSGLWPSVLPRLRARARVKRGDLVAELADRLGAGGAQREKVAGYYHQMEQGLLPASGVADEVLDALAGVVGSTRAALREAGESLASGAGGSSAEVFARSAPGAADVAESPPPPASPGTEGDGFDEVDRLFRGG